jgi:dTDP-glucose 4,6-dehydratase
MRLLVTGGAGFIGSNLIHHVIDRPEIEILVNLDCLSHQDCVQAVTRKEISHAS